MSRTKLILDDSKIPYFKNKYIFIDNDFLGELFKDTEIFEDFVTSFEKNLLIAPFTVFEFLRDFYSPQLRDVREEFISNSEIFITEPDHPEIYQQLKDNALILSQIYSSEFNRIKSGARKSNASMVDLFLAARLMNGGSKCILVTGNKKDFPSFIFDTPCVFNYETNEGIMRSICMIEFNKAKFEKCYHNLLEMKLRI